MEILDKRCCDVYKDSQNTQTIREWIHETHKYIYHGGDISDNMLDKMSESYLKEFIDELDWVSRK